MMRRVFTSQAAPPFDGARNGIPLRARAGGRPVMRRVLAGLGGLVVAGWLAVCAAPADNFHFVLLGDRTGEAQPGVYERIWKELAATQPALVLSVGDTIQGLNDATAEAEWRGGVRPPQPYPPASPH